MPELREVVRRIPASLAALKVVTRDDPDALVIFIPLEQIFAIGKEIRMGYTIVFKNNGGFNLIKHPVQAARYPSLKPHILIGIVAKHLTGPIDLSNDGSDFFALLRFLRPICTRAVSDQKQLLGLLRTDAGKRLPRVARSVEHNQGNG